MLHERRDVLICQKHGKSNFSFCYKCKINKIEKLTKALEVARTSNAFYAMPSRYVGTEFGDNKLLPSKISRDGGNKATLAEAAIKEIMGEV